MIDTIAQSATGDDIERVLRDDLALGDAQLGSIAPILRHLLNTDEHSVFSDEIVARVRGMAGDVARQLLDATAEIPGGGMHQNHPREVIEALSSSVFAHPGFLAHCHALALEWQLTERLQARLALDPVLTPLLQALISSPEPTTAASAMALLASQARFAQAQRRMQLPLTELPGDLLHAALKTMRGHAAPGPDVQERAAAAEAKVRGNYDESRSRLGLIARLVSAMGGGARAALSVSHAGVAVFLSALSLASGQDRDLTVLTTNEGQLTRLALALRSAGIKPAAVEEQFLALHPDAGLPAGFEQLGADRAAALLARSNIYAGG